MKKIVLGSVLLFSFYISSAYAQVVLSEIAWMGTTASVYDEWIELYNYSENEINLNGWSLQSTDKKLNISLKGIVPAPKDLADVSRFFLLERTDDSTTEKTADLIYTGALKNTDTQLQLKNNIGLIVDQTPLETWVAGNNTQKRSMERIDFTSGGLNTANWNTFEGTWNTKDAKNNIINGSPKQKNSKTPAELFAPKPTLFEQKYFFANISQISPNTFNDQPEWFSVFVQSESAIDVTDWVISNGKTNKKFRNIFDTILWNNDDFYQQNLSGLTHKNIIYDTNKKYLLPKLNVQNNYHEGIFYFHKSPVSLSDKGGQLILKTIDETLIDKKEFPKAIKTTLKGQKLRESFLYKDETRTSVLQTENTSSPADFLNKTFVPPTISNQVQLYISEIAASRINEPDFIEIFIEKAPKNGANLKYLEIKHNGSILLFFTEDYLVHAGDFLLIYFDKGSTKIQKENKHIFSANTRSSVSTTSGTIEINIFANTSQEEVVDTACWYKEILNKTESKRVSNQVSDFTCQKHLFIPQESLAKNNKNEDYFSHPHGTPGEANILKNIKNFRPIPVITKQANGINSINVTAQNSVDPNGNWDLKKFYWKLKFGVPTKEKTFQSFSIKNPVTQTVSNHKSLSESACQENQYKIELTVTDSLGLFQTDNVYYPLYWDKTCKIGVPKINKKIIDSFEWQEPKISATDIWKSTSFFSDFEKIGKLDKTPQPKILPKKIYNTQYERIIFDKKITPEQIQKNIGLIF